MSGNATSSPAARIADDVAQRRRVCIVQRIVPHYRVPFFQALHRELADTGIDLELIHGQEFPGTVPRGEFLDERWASRVNNRYIRIASQELVWQPASVRTLAGADLVIVEHANRLLLNYPLLAARGPRRRVAFWGHGANFQSTQDSAAETFKRNLARTADWWFAYTNGGARLVESYGFPPERVTVVNNAIDSRAIREAVDGVDAATLADLRAELGIEGPGVAIFSGRLVPEKRLELLWDAALRIRERCPTFTLLVVGEGPLGPDVARMAEQHPWIHALGAKSGAALAPYLALSDFLMIPGLVGLVVVDAFAAGVPLVTTRIDTHSPEIEYLEPGVNGMIAEPDGASLADAALRLLESPALLDRMRAGCRAAAGVYTLEAMVERFAQGVRGALDSQPAGR